MKEKIKRIAEHYGYKHQRKKLIEEMAELTAEIFHLDERGDYRCPESCTAVIDEIADVSLMIEEIVHLLGCEDGVKRRIAYKVKRQLERIKAEEETGILKSDVHRGEIYWQNHHGKLVKCLIVSNELDDGCGNRIAVSVDRITRKYASDVELAINNEIHTARCQFIHVIDTDNLRGFIQKITPEEMKKVEAAMCIGLGMIADAEFEFD